ncbi:uncharacterized protein METZ01_LOCUS132739 [marine metagenome]|uniref:Transporter n=1 Tax=marine metagenome TaxID=408172 RepID=A0A381YS90_9ZZZZ
MSQPTATEFVHERWSSQNAFVLATVGSAVGLGNIWRFPYIAGQNGGGVFVLVYLLCIACIGIPLLMAELAMGRRGGHSAPATMQRLAADAGRGKFWHSIGWFAVITPMLAITFYGVVAGWSLDYIVLSITGRFDGIDAQASARVFGNLTGSPVRLACWQALFMLLTAIVVARGVRKGLEVATKLLMPVLAALVVLLVLYGAITADFAGALKFLFTPDLAKLNGTVILMALGQAFFSLAIGVGAMITYAAYMPPSVSIPKAAITIAAADTTIALMMGLAIFPLVFASGLAPAEGPGLLFISLPIAFGQMPGGIVFATLFFVLTFIAALTSSIAMLEPIVCWLEEHRGFSRPISTVVLAAGAWLVGLSVVLSFNLWSEIRPLGVFDYFADKTIFDLFDFLTANVMMPVGALLLAAFAGWAMQRESIRQEVGLADGAWYRIWMFLLRFVVPIGIGAILFSNLLAA